MNIQRKVDTIQKFGDLCSGSVFIDPNCNGVYMKMDYVGIDDDDGYNAVNLEDGDCDYFHDHERVIIPDYTFKIES